MPADLKVTLLQHTPAPERAVASAGRLCYAPVSAAQLKEDMADDEVRRLVAGLVRSGHISALEHAGFTFAIDGISRACSHQLVRHRLASYSQQSQRYVRFSSEEEFVVPPPGFMASSEAREVFYQAMTHAREAYERLVELGLAEGRGKESVFEDARFVLPNAAETKIVVTMNARELRHFFAIRCCRPGTMGDQQAGLGHAPSGPGGRAGSVRRHRARLHDGGLSGGQDDLRGAVHGVGDTHSRVGPLGGRAGVMSARRSEEREAPVCTDYSFGGQAVIEGVMMRGRNCWAVAVRRPSGGIARVAFPLDPPGSRNRLLRLPVVRGVVALSNSMRLGAQSTWHLGQHRAGRGRRRRLQRRCRLRRHS